MPTFDVPDRRAVTAGENLASAADSLRRALRQVVTEAQNALDSLDLGALPDKGPLAGHRVLSQAADDVQSYAAVLAVTAKYARALGLTAEQVENVLGAPSDRDLVFVAREA